MVATRTCSKCGSEFSGSALQGLCPSCVGRLAFVSELEASAGAVKVSHPSGTKLRYFGDYELLEEIARGGMGVVYKARQLSLNRIVAVKMILSGKLASTADVARFRAEAEAAANLRHPNIVAIHEVGEQDGQHYFSMDYVEGKSLAELVAGHPLPSDGRGIKDEGWFRRVAGWVKTIAEAIHYAHGQGTLHRDLKPSNVLIDSSDHPHITDFGLAKRVKHDSDLTVSGQILGTPNFMSPEQAAGKRGGAGPQSDVYSLGAMLYFLLTGKPPHAGETVHETLAKVLGSEPAAPRALNRNLPRDLETICLKCLEKEPRSRYASARDLAEDLDRFLQDQPILARPIGKMEGIWRRCHRHPVVASLTFGLIITVAALLIQHGRMGKQESARSVKPMPARGGNGISAVIDGKIYVTTPMEGFGGGVGDFYAYDPAKNAWLNALDATPVVHKRPCGGAIGRKFYLVGGLNQNNVFVNRLDIYDPASGKWSAGAPMRVARCAAASAVLDGKLYALGGEGLGGDSNVLGNVEFYDAKRDKWADAPSMPTPRRNAGAAVMGRNIYVVGGTGAENRPLGTLEALGPDGVWMTLSHLPRPVTGPFVAARNGIVYVAGGLAGANDIVASLQESTRIVLQPAVQLAGAKDDVITFLQAYEVATDRWTQLAPMPEPRFDGCGAQWVGGLLVVMGGWTYIPEALPHNDAFVYDPAGGVWRR